MFFISKEEINRLKDLYPPNTRVKLIQFSDTYRKLPEGLMGTVTCVDDIGTIHVDWDNGIHIGLIPGEDICRIVEQTQKIDNDDIESR